MAYKIGQVIIDNTSGSWEKIEIMESDKVKATALRKIGVLAEPGSKMEINGEEIWIGRTGTYEINIDTVFITSLKVLSKTKYIINYKY